MNTTRLIGGIAGAADFRVIYVDSADPTGFHYLYLKKDDLLSESPDHIKILFNGKPLWLYKSQVVVSQ